MRGRGALRIVLDSSVLVSSLLKPQGVPAQVMDAWRAHRFQAVTSPAIVRKFVTRWRILASGAATT